MVICDPSRVVFQYNTYMSEIIFVVEQAPEGGLAARALGASIFTQAETAEELHARVRDAVRCHFGEEAPDAAISGAVA